MFREHILVLKNQKQQKNPNQNKTKKEMGK